MNKTVTLILVILALALIVYNATLIDYQQPLEGKSIIALIGIVAALCAIVLLLIYQTSKKIEKKIDGK
jgi:hypothetical protein